MREHWWDLAFSLTAGEQHGELEPAVLIPRMFLQCFTYFMACVYLLHRYDYVFVAGITLFSCFRSFKVPILTPTQVVRTPKEPHALSCGSCSFLQPRSANARSSRVRRRYPTS